MGHPAHDAPPPPGREFVFFLAIVAIVCVAIGNFVIAPIAGDAFLFVLGFIAFFAPLIGWGVTVSFGKRMWRMGDFIPVTMLFISFLCGAAIFKSVIIDEYDPGFAQEYRFNWFSVAGDDANDATGRKTLSEHEYAALGVKMLSERAVKSGHALDLDASVIVEEAALYWDRADRPNLSAFDPMADDAADAFANLNSKLQLGVVAWLTKAKIAERITHEAHAANIQRLEAELQSVDSAKRKARISKYLKELKGQEVLAPTALHAWDDQVFSHAFQSLEGELASYAQANGAKIASGEEGYEPAIESLKKLFLGMQAFVYNSADEASQATMDLPEEVKTKEVSATELGTLFVQAEQAILDWRYEELDPYYNAELKTDFTKAEGYLAYPTDLSKAKDKHFQAFAIGILIDNVTACVLLMVTLLAFLIHLFSIGYMYGEIRYTRFMATINLFTAGMIGLVLANNFLWLFVCWEIMGLCSYLLIGHYFEKRSAQEASMKAFFTTRIADTFMFLGMMMIFAYTGTFLFAGSAEASLAMEATGSFMGDVVYAGEGSFFNLLGSTEMLIGGLGAFAIGFLCFLGPAGKSAQFPFHVWLPDAMEGPTPVSAMIHAACMVSAGVYLTARLFPLFTPEVLEIIALVGGFTALAAGTIGLVQTDLKKVLAYSTISQLGYMFLGIGVGSWYPALFHMLTHAFFKALMFLGSGSVILGCHHEQEMPKMGGIWKKMPITTITFWVGNLSIIGLPFFFAAYYSKEAILTDSILLGESGGSWLPYVFGALGAGLTTFYMCRLMWLTFHGSPRDKHLYDNIKESPWTVTVPLIVIAVGSLFVSWPIGMESKPDFNLGVTHISQNKLAGVEDQGVNPDGTAKKRPQHGSESNLAYIWWKPASVWSQEFLAAESPDVDEERLTRLYADKHGRAAFSNEIAWRKHDMVVVKDTKSFYSHGEHDANGDEHGDDHTDEHAHSAVDPSGKAVVAAAMAEPGHDDADGHDDWSIVDGHAVHEFHEKHHHAHIIAFIFALIMLALGIGVSMFLYLGPMAGKDWVGHKGWRYRTKKTLQEAYNVDAFYFATVLRANRWIRQFCAWFDRTFVDGFVNLWGVVARWKAKVAAKVDFWGVDGTVRGVSNATEWTGRQAQRATTGKIQDYVFLLVAGIVILYIVIVLFQ